jgi:16S rRNA (cytosine967-C5)-methyltransferase
MLKAENEDQLQAFLATHKAAQIVDFSLNLSNQIKRDIGYQCLPLHQNDGDGFYYALLQKRG